MPIGMYVLKYLLQRLLLVIIIIMWPLWVDVEHDENICFLLFFPFHYSDTDFFLYHSIRPLWQTPFEAKADHSFERQEWYGKVLTNSINTFQIQDRSKNIDNANNHMLYKSITTTRENKCVQRKTYSIAPIWRSSVCNFLLKLACNWYTLDSSFWAINI